MLTLDDEIRSIIELLPPKAKAAYDAAKAGIDETYPLLESLGIPAGEDEESWNTFLETWRQGLSEKDRYEIILLAGLEVAAQLAIMHILAKEVPGIDLSLSQAEALKLYATKRTTRLQRYNDLLQDHRHQRRSRTHPWGL